MAKDGGFQFLGIPYAIPPGSKLTNNEDGVSKDYKWEPGTRPFRLEHCWEGELKYPAAKPSECLQIRPSASGKSEVIGSDDCLTLDIYTPMIGYDTPSPVVVVIAIPSLVGGWPDESYQGTIFSDSNVKIVLDTGLMMQ